MQRKTLFTQACYAARLRWHATPLARHRLVRELSLVLLIKLALLYGIINFIVPSATAINDSDVSTRLLNLEGSLPSRDAAPAENHVPPADAQNPKTETAIPQ